MRVAVITKYGTIESIDKTLPFYGTLATGSIIDLNFGTSYYGELPSITFTAGFLDKNNIVIMVDNQQYVLTSMMLRMMTFDENNCCKLTENVVIHRSNGYLGTYNIAVNHNIKDVKGFRFIPSESFLKLKHHMQYTTNFMIEHLVHCEIDFGKLNKIEDTTVDELEHVHINIPERFIESTLRDAIVYTTPPWDRYVFSFRDHNISCLFNEGTMMVLPETPVHFEWYSERHRWTVKTK